MMFGNHNIVLAVGWNCCKTNEKYKTVRELRVCVRKFYGCMQIFGRELCAFLNHDTSKMRFVQTLGN